MPRRKHIIQLPDDVNPDGFLTLKKAAEITGLPISTFYNLRRLGGDGLRFYWIAYIDDNGKERRKLVVKCNELLRWLDFHVVEAPISRKRSDIK